MITSTAVDVASPAGTSLTPPRGTYAALTASERRVLALLASGLAPKQAAWELRVRISTVRSHIAAAKRKTGARTLHQLVGEFADFMVSARPGTELGLPTGRPEVLS